MKVFQIKRLGLTCFLLTTLTLSAQTTTENYIISETARIAETDTTVFNSLPVSSKATSIGYFDGLGRPIQEIAYQLSPGQQNIIQTHQYDQFGRELKQYLPFSSGTSLDFSTSVLTDQYSFYQNQARLAHSTTPWSETVVEASPLQRMLEQGAPGADWQIGANTIKKDYRSNYANEVRSWNWVGQSSGNYAANTLYVTQTTDENGNPIYEYVDKLGRTVLKKSYVETVMEYQFEGGDGSPVDVFACTYYIYHDNGSLLFVVPPQAFKDMQNANNYDLTNSTWQDRIYKYIYDARQRLIEKKIPHKGWEYIVYDNLDRPILTQDANQRSTNKWSFTKFDALSRPIITGLCTISGTRASVQSAVNDVLANNVLQNHEKRSSSSFTTQWGYTNSAYPTLGMGTTLLTVTWYDDYDFNYNGTADVTPSAFPVGYTEPVTLRTLSLVTRTAVNILGTSTYLYTTTFYDNRARPLQTTATNHIGGSDVINMKYNFLGELLNSHHVHTANGKPTITLQNRQVYDHAGRLTDAYMRVNTEPEVMLYQNVYNELGQIVEKNIHANIPGSIPYGWQPAFLQSVDYAYNIRGWLTHINNADLSNDMAIEQLTIATKDDAHDFVNDDDDDLWGLELSYNNIGGKTLIDDNITLDETNFDDGTLGVWLPRISANNITVTNGRTKVTANNNAEGLRKAFPITAGKRYRVSFNLEVVQATEIRLTVIDAYNSAVQALLTAVSTGHVSQTFIAPNTTHIAVHIFVPNSAIGPNYNFYLDNIVLVEEDAANYSYTTNLPTGGTPLYNGNISSQHWQSATDAAKRSYSYAYDRLNRIQSATYNAFNPTAETWTNESGRFNTFGISFDLNGNIKTLKRNGLTAGIAGQNATFGLMDNLSYIFSGDQLLSVADASGVNGYTNDFKDGNTQNPDYSYDANGNMITDLNKGITVSYNHLNLPTQVNFGTANKIEYTYDAYGTKLKKKVTQLQPYSIVLKQVDYAGAMQYVDGALDFIFTQEGRIVADNSTHRYEYYYKDHLGNSRLGFSDNNGDGSITTEEVTQQTNYYAFGLEHQGQDYGVGTQTDHKYRYNGKELQDEFGLDWLDFGWRMYDAAIGRWHCADSKAEEYFDWSPYNYVLGNPIRNIDPFGEDVYMLFYTTGNPSGDAAFKSAAQTRKEEIEGGESFNSKTDKVIMLGVSDLADVETLAEWTTDTYSEQYGETAEVGMWSHAGMDGPIGTTETSNNPLYSKGETFRGSEKNSTSKQMSLDGWNSINFNWKESGSKIGFYGCNTGNEVDSKRGWVGSFARNVSGMSSYNNVSTWGQSTSSYPSTAPHIRATTASRSMGLFLNGPTYMVGGNKGQGAKSHWFTPGSYPAANPMNVYLKGKKVRTSYQGF